MPERLELMKGPTANAILPMASEQIIGWAAVLALFLTMAGQAWKQWRDRVFVVGTALVLLASIAGGAILLWNRARR